MCFSFFQSATIFIYSFHRVNINLVYAIANKQTINQFIPFVAYLFFHILYEYLTFTIVSLFVYDLLLCFDYMFFCILIEAFAELSDEFAESCSVQ